MDSTQVAFLVDIKSFGNPFDIIGLRYTRTEIWTIDVSYIELLNVCQSFLIRVDVVHSNEDYAPVFVLAPGLFQISGFLAAGRAPGSPEVDNDHLPTQLTQSHCSSIEAGQAKIRSQPAIYWPCLGFLQPPRQ